MNNTIRTYERANEKKAFPGLSQKRVKNHLCKLKHIQCFEEFKILMRSALLKCSPIRTTLILLEIHDF